MYSFRIVIAAVVCLAVGGLSGFFTGSSMYPWYDTIVKPSFNPPSWIFGPVWTALYIMMGIAAGLIWNIKPASNESKRALIVFGIHMLVNAAWSFIFFGVHQIGWALMEILLLLGLILYCIKLFYPLNKIAAYLLIPYLIWVSFATILNASIWWLN